MSSPDATGHSEPDPGDLTREQAGSDLLTLTRDELTRLHQAVVEEALERKLADLETRLADQIHAQRALLRDAMTRLCELGDTARSSPLVRAIIQTLGH